MKRVFISFVLSWILLVPALAQKHAGFDGVYPFDAPAMVSAPKGYEPFYLSHYGRHGSRYAWQKDIYDKTKALFDKAHRDGNLTPLGESVRERIDELYESVRYRVGELTEKGREQEAGIASEMSERFPGLFRQRPVVRAYGSTSMRAVMSMGAFCVSLGQLHPELDIRMYQSNVYLYKIIPDSHANPYRVESKPGEVPYKESVSEYGARYLDYGALLGRLFRNVSAAVPKDQEWNEIYRLYDFVEGMNSLDGRIRFDDVFTPEIEENLWKTVSYSAYRSYRLRENPYRRIVKDIVDCASERVADGKAAIDLRFGHDYVLGCLMCLMDINGMAVPPPDPDRLTEVFSTDMIPMGANLQLVFYRPRKDIRRGRPSDPDDVLVRILLNGREVSIPSLTPETASFYRWTDLRDHLASVYVDSALIE